MENKYKVGTVVNWLEDGLAYYKIIKVYPGEGEPHYGKRYRLKCLEDDSEFEAYEKYIKLTPAGKVLYEQS